MKNRLVKNYTFDASAKTVSCTDFTDIERIVTIINQTDGIIIYNPINPSLGGTLSNGVLTLDYDTSSMDDTDKLVIYVDHPTSNFKWSFAKVVASGVDTEAGSVIATGAGMAISQTNGNLVVTTGTTAYSESIIRSNKSFEPNGIVRWGLTLSQRIANNNFIVEFVDVVGDGLSMTINSTTSVTVTKTAHGFTTSDIGKGIWIGNISVASCLPQRAVIASIPTVNTITFTVTGFPASGSGTCSLFGYNYHQVIYNGTSATALGGGYNTQRFGWQTAHGSTTINTTASGHISTITSPTQSSSQYADETLVTGTGNQSTGRLSAKQNVPEGIPLYLQIRAFNGSTAPASTTTMTVSFVDAIMYDPQIVMLGGATHISPTNSIPVSQQGTVATSMAASSTSPAKAQDSAMGATDVGIPSLFVRRDAPTSLTPVAGDYAFPQVSNLGAQYVASVAHTAGGATPYKLVSAATTNATSVKASAGQVYSIMVTNTNAAVRYFKLYNKASAPTVGTDTPVQVYAIPGATTGGGFTLSIPVGMAFATGIAFATTTGAADSDTGAVAANELLINLTYL